MRAPQPSGTNSPSSSSHAYPSGCAIESHERCATARVARGDPAALTGPYRPARERPARARPWRRGSPGPIPNPEVKPFSADGTAAGTLWETRTPPDQHLQERAPHPPHWGSGALSFFMPRHTPHPPGNEPRESCSARFWSVRSRKTHINPTSFLTGPGEQILLPTDDVSAHTPGIPP